jgi:hypothetical protein
MGLLQGTMASEEMLTNMQPAFSRRAMRVGSLEREVGFQAAESAIQGGDRMASR